MKLRPILVAVIVGACLHGAARAQDSASSRDEKSLRERVDASEGKERGAASAEFAKLLESQGRWSEAASAWREARKSRGDAADFEGEARAVLSFAEDVVAQGETGGAVAAAFEDARAALRKAREAGGKSVEIALGLARCAEISGDVDGRIGELTAASQAAPDDLRPARALAAAMTSAGKTDAALSLYAKLSESHPKDASLALDLYAAARLAGDDAESQAAATRAIDAAPQDVRGWGALWHVFSDKQRWGELATACVAIAKADPKAEWASHYAGIACAKARRFDDALEWLRNAWTLKDSDPDARCEAARILFAEKNDREGAIKLLTEAFERDPGNEQANALMFFVGRRIWEEGNPKGAAPVFEVIAKARPKGPVAQNNFANTLRFAGRYDDSEKKYLALIETFPNEAQLRNDYALLLDVEGRNDDARKVLAAAHEVDPANNDSMENLGFLARAKGDRDEALKWFRAAHAALVKKGENDHKHRINVDDQRWPLPPPQGAPR